VNPYKILVVEDDSDISELIKIVLFSLSYSIACIDSVAVAFAKLTEQKPDLVVVDLPELDEWKFYKSIRAKPEFRHTRVVILTDLLFVPKYHILPADLAMEKPFEIDELRTNVKKLLSAEKSQNISSLGHVGYLYGRTRPVVLSA
jgi:DNA-binding response OmpR family regulator